jgi:hypothetical protein
MKVELTGRGFERIDFADANGEACSIQQSSAIGDDDDAFERPGSSMLWLGVNDPVPKVLVQNEGWQPVPLPEDVLLSGRMHMNREMVIELVVKLRNWLDSGSFDGSTCLREYE